MEEERFPGKTRATLLATDDSQFSRRKPRAWLLGQCPTSTAARGCRTFPGWLGPSAFRQNQPTEFQWQPPGRGRLSNTQTPLPGSQACYSREPRRRRPQGRCGAESGCGGRARRRPAPRSRPDWSFLPLLPSETRPPSPSPLVPRRAPQGALYPGRDRARAPTRRNRCPRAPGRRRLAPYPCPSLAQRWGPRTDTAAAAARRFLGLGFQFVSGVKSLSGPERLYFYPAAASGHQRAPF